MTPKPPRSWFINPVCNYICEVNENGIGLTGNEIHVVEHSALTDALAAIERHKSASTQMCNERNDALAEIERLKRDYDSACELAHTNEVCLGIAFDKEREKQSAIISVLAEALEGMRASLTCDHCIKNHGIANYALEEHAKWKKEIE